MSAGTINIADLVWHYTTGDCFRGILTDMEIRPATALVAKGETPVVWFSTNQAFERSALKGLEPTGGGPRRTATMDEMDRLGGGLFRIGVHKSIAPFDWWEFKRRSRIKEGIAKGLVKAARQLGANPAEWRVAFGPVSLTTTAVCLQRLVAGEWSGLDELGHAE
jgi:hypothetical protein